MGERILSGLRFLIEFRDFGVRRVALLLNFFGLLNVFEKELVSLVINLLGSALLLFGNKFLKAVNPIDLAPSHSNII